jgi:hypothetical protein
MQNQINVTVADSNESQTISFIGSLGLKDIVQKLLSLASIQTSAPAPDENSVVFSFLRRTGSKISFETPQSSNVQRVTFDASEGKIGFVFDNDSESTYPAKFQEFVDAMSAPSVGKLQWAYRRSVPKVGDRVRVVSADIGATGANGHTGSITELPYQCGTEGGLRVLLDGYGYPRGKVWSLGKNATVAILGR